MRRLLLAVSLLGCSADDAPEKSCDPLALAREASSSGALDCGHVARGTDPRPAWQCAAKAFRDGTPFRVSEQRAGIDSEITFAVTRRADRTVDIFTRDSDPTGGGGATPTVDHTTCMPGVLVADAMDGIERVGCGSPYTTTRLCP